MTDDDPTSPISEFEDEYSASFRSAPRSETFSSDLLEESIASIRPSIPVCVQASEMTTGVVLGMSERNHGAVLVVDGDVLVGIFSERDFMRRVFRRRDPDTTPVSEVMTRDPECLGPEHSIAFVLNKMTVGGFRHVPIVDAEGRPVGIVSVKDIVQLIASRFPNHVLPVPPEPRLRMGHEDG